MNRKRITLAALSIIALAAIIIAVDSYLDHREDQKKIALFTPLVPLIDIPDNTDTAATADAIRTFINDNSIHRIDKEFYSYWGNRELIINMIKNHATGATSKRPHMECSSRSAFMRYILQNMGYRVRSVDVSTHRENFPAHVFMEVQDPKTGRWHIQDPGYDLFWINKDTKERLNAIDLIKLGADNILPCHTQDQCGWAYKNASSQGHQKALKPYLGLAVIKDKIENTRDLYYNSTIFPLNTPTSHTDGTSKTYCMAFSKNCRGEITDLNHQSKL